MKQFEVHIGVENEDETILPDGFIFELEQEIRNAVENCPYWESGDDLDVDVTVLDKTEGR